jgi:hypothetical protein
LEHWISIDCSWFKNVGIDVSELITVFYDSKIDKWIVQNEPNASLQSKRIQEIPIYGFAEQSFPPFEALCLYGGDEIEK